MEGKKIKNKNTSQAKTNPNRTKIRKKTMLNNDIKSNKNQKKTMLNNDIKSNKNNDIQILIFKLYFKFKLGKYTVVLVEPPTLHVGSK